MSLVAPYVDGKLQTSTTSSDSLGRKSSNSVVDSDTFLTLLVAEMQNQDPWSLPAIQSGYHNMQHLHRFSRLVKWRIPWIW
ncbi:MAG: flagellar hook capping FlgD N-terminal domain-containing protein [Lachnospiraceae bacterium]